MPSIKKLLQAAAGNAGESLYVEDVFSTYLYEGTGSAMTITNGIDLDGEGGLVWIKNRDTIDDNVMFSPTFGANKMQRITTAALETVGTDVFQSFNSNGFTHGGWGGVGGNGNDIASWTFRKAEKFFDVVTYTGDGVAGRTVAHNLGSVPAVMLIKRTSASGDDWAVYHSGLGATQLIALNTAAASLGNPWLTNTAPTDSVFTLNNYGFINASGSSYVAYLFASDAGGFGDDGDESIIKCGSYSGNSSTNGPEINLGFEPQFLLVKAADKAEYWVMADTMRGITGSTTDPWSAPNVSEAEFDDKYFEVQATGFRPVTADARLNGSAYNYIYIAIRRPMKTPESGTEVFNPTTAAVTTDITNNFAADLWFGNNTSGNGGNNAHTFASRLTGLKWLQTATTLNESTASNSFYWDSNTEFTNSQFGGDRVEYFLKRATGFFDVVAYTGDGSAGSTQAHNLGVVPQLIIIKRRNSTSNWAVQSQEDGTKYMMLNHEDGNTGSSLYWNNTAPTTTQFTLGSTGDVNSNSSTYIAYLFGSVDGVSKVGSYTGTGSNVNVDCGFSAGARFILIKRTDSTGDWYVWDSARGIVAGNDPYLLLNTTAAEVTSTDYIDPLASGFTVTSSAPAALNASGGTYLFMAIS